MVKPKVLLIAPFSFCPPDAGGKMVVYNNVTALSQYFDVHLLFPTPQDSEHIKGIEKLKEKFKVFTVDIPFPKGRKKTLKEWIFYCANIIFRKMPFQGILDKFYGDPIAKKLIQENFLFIQLEHSTWYHSALRKRLGKLVLIEHNYEPEFWFQFGWAFIYRKRLAIGLCYLFDSIKIWCQDRCAVKDADIVFTLSDRDRRLIKKFSYNKKNIYELHNGFYPDAESNQVDFCFEQKEKINLCFVGSMDYLPNEDAVLFFIDQVMPLLNQSGLSYHFHIVGRSPSKEVENLIKKNILDITVTGYVKDIKSYIRQSDIFIVPIRFGAGVSIKLMEAMTLGKPIVATSKAIRSLSLPVENGVLVADSAKNFSQQILRLSNDFVFRKNCGDLNLKISQECYDWQKNFCEKILPLLCRLGIEASWR